MRSQFRDKPKIFQCRRGQKINDSTVEDCEVSSGDPDFQNLLVPLHPALDFFRCVSQSLSSKYVE